jgi:rare lipoprotein A
MRQPLAKRQLLKERDVPMSTFPARWCARSISVGAAIVLVVMTASCAGTVDVPTEAATPPVPLEAAATAPTVTAFRQTGTASWYGKDLNGRRTASGERFDMYGLSTAHRTLPLGSMIRVTNLENNRSTTVRVNDRGPFIKSRMIDLSYGAARELGFVAEGTATVEIQRLDELPGTTAYTVHAAQYVEEENARLLKERLSAKFETIAIIPEETDLGTVYHVEVGVYPTEEKAELVAGRVMQEGLLPVVIRKDQRAAGPREPAQAGQDNNDEDQRHKRHP